MRGCGDAASQRGPPLVKRLQQLVHVDSAEFLRAGGKIFPPALHQRASSREIPGRMMVKCYCGLDKPLQEFLFHTFGFAPYVFPDFMSVIELTRIEETNPAVIAISVHES